MFFFSVKTQNITAHVRIREQLVKIEIEGPSVTPELNGTRTDDYVLRSFRLVCAIEIE
jgi:hypothetical protein